MGRPLLVGFHGVKRSGKDTAATYLQEWASGRSLSFCRRGFADIAKLAFARQFYPTITMEAAVKWVDTFKDSGYAFWYPTGDDPEQPKLQSVPFRQCMAQFATEGARLIYGNDHWVDLLLPTAVYIDGHDLPLYPKWHDSFEMLDDEAGPRVADVCAIIDLRFDNEVERIRRLGGMLVKIRRISAERAVQEEARERGISIHDSELGIPDQEFDYVVDNNHELSDLKRQIESLAMMLATEGADDTRRPA
jgi:hypothetical protein